MKLHENPPVVEHQYLTRALSWSNSAASRASSILGDGSNRARGMLAPLSPPKDEPHEPGEPDEPGETGKTGENFGSPTSIFDAESRVREQQRE
eukprot:COSAG04_NODE_25713_length_304_cov_0.726829_1_plen_92_part_10